MPSLSPPIRFCASQAASRWCSSRERGEGAESQAPFLCCYLTSSWPLETAHVVFCWGQKSYFSCMGSWRLGKALLTILLTQRQRMKT